LKAIDGDISLVTQTAEHQGEQVLIEGLSFRQQAKCAAADVPQYLLAGRSVLAGVEVSGSNRMVKENVLPWPGRLIAENRAAHQLDKAVGNCEAETGSPKRRVVLPCPWINGSKTFCCCSAVMPMPVSLTWKRTDTPVESVISKVSTETSTSPCSVNFTALPMRFVSTCRRRVKSPDHALRAVGGDPLADLDPFAAGFGSNQA